MESVKKWLTARNTTKNGLYVHYSPPKLLGVVASAQLRRWLREGVGDKLERAVLAGQGRRLLGEADARPLDTNLPALVAKCEALHAAVERGSLLELQEQLQSDFYKKKFVSCRDEAGVGLLHKAVYYDFTDIAEWLVRNFPHLVNQRDSAGRTPLHYAAACRDAAAAAALLEGAGAARGARDATGRTPAHYRGGTRAALPAEPADMADKRNPPGLVIKRHNIRIWCHDCDMAKLQRVVWEGHGTRLLSEVCNQPVVKKFLEAVPYIMNTIRDIHTAVVQNRLEDLIKHAGDPVPPVALSSRDVNNMTVMHKAAGLGHGGILKYITERYPEGINDVDSDGRTPLHYAAAVRDEQHLFNTLVGLGADESAVDNKNKTPGYYLNRQHEIDKSNLKTIPDAPRTASSAYPPSWDWKLLDTEVIVQELNKKSRRRVKGSNGNISSNNTNTVSESTKDYRTGGMKASSTHELIKDLPDLEDLKKSQENLHQESEVVEESNEPDSNDVEPTPNNDHINEDANGSPEPEINIEHDTKETKEDKEDDREEELQEKEPDVNAENLEEDEHKGKEENIDTNISGHEEKEEHKDHDLVKTQTEHQDHANEVDHIKDKEVDEYSDVDDKNEPESNENVDKHIEQNDNDKEEPTNESENNSDEETEQPTNKESEEDDRNTAESEGNNKEDDDDVQTQGESQSEYSDFNLTSTAEASDTASAKRGYQTGGRNTQESLIEGLVSGEAEMDSQDAGLNHEDDSVQADVLVVDNEIDPEVSELINNANMEMLAALVLNGEGARLIGRNSRNLELQAFLENVPTYMKKIHKVHIAAREGNIRDLQAALDRRKFAIARDSVSPNGATPLHVATVFGKTNIIKYLGGRFPETLSAVDFEGRTALHYAAVLPDNGHYYNLLQQLGANSKDLDDNGRSAEDYSKNPALLPFDQILTDFGISDDALQDMLSDKGGSDAGNGQMDIPIFKTEEGRYLAKSLGDPLIKGLTEVANVKPKDPVAFLASFLQNFPEHEKTRLGTQETNILVMRESAEVENEAPPRAAPQTTTLQTTAPQSTVAPPMPIDVITVDPQPELSPDAPEIALSSANRDEHGQSMLHFAVARSHTRNALFELLQESDINLAYRDELYRTARDVSIQANLLENTAEVDRFVIHLAARGNTEKIMELLLEGYDHILNVVDEEGMNITEVVSQRNNPTMSSLLASIPTFEESREGLQNAVRRGDLPAVQRSCLAEGGRTLARAKNSFGRTALHVAVLAQREEVVDYLAQTFPELLRIGDNLERSPLHYAMGVENMESLSRVLIRAGAKRVLKDLKGRQPSYYFMNKSDILRLKEEEEVY